MTNDNDICAGCNHERGDHEHGTGPCAQWLGEGRDCDCQHFIPQQPERGDEKCETNSPTKGESVHSPAAGETKAALAFSITDSDVRKFCIDWDIKTTNVNRLRELIHEHYTANKIILQLQEKLRQAEAERDRYKKVLEEAHRECREQSYLLVEKLIKNGLIENRPTKE